MKDVGTSRVDHHKSMYPAPGQSPPNSMDSHSVSESPTLIKVTGYRMLMPRLFLRLVYHRKGVASYRNESILFDTLDILWSMVLAVGQVEVRTVSFSTS